MAIPLGCNDMILFVSLVYSSIDIHLEWDSFSRCVRPIHHWLFLSFALVIIFRTTHLLGMRNSAAGGGDFLLDLRQKDTVPRYLAFFTWLLALPAFLLWTLVGTKWLWDVVRETPSCFPTSTHLWFSIFWLALCYIWIVIHAALGAVAWLLERRVRKAEGDLREIEDAEVIERWGQVSQLSGYRALAGPNSAGLKPSEIISLPSYICSPHHLRMKAEQGEDYECSICLYEFKPGDEVRQLGVCDHQFHRSCIDLWLLRNAGCPLCKRSVKSSKVAS
mmetsp:Transcript_12367/g.23279  ORF Transcript_12367/g.23279 Transcript_12367/m.23279 type:complete len:276 (-) Transcript_12367:48-875(-)